MTNELSVQRLARTAGLLMLLSAVFGGLGEAYIPGRIIVSGDASATVLNITTHSTLFRLGFATYLVEAICDVGLALLFYRLLRPAGKNLALFAAFLGLVSTAVYAVAEAFYFAPTVILSGADYLKTFSPQQLNTLAFLSLRLFVRITGIFFAFYGLATIIRGYLIYRSGYLPRTLGVVLMVAGAGFIAQNLAIVLAPAYASDYLLVPVGIAGLLLMFWLLIKGVDLAKWNARSLPVVTASMLLVIAATAGAQAKKVDRSSQLKAGIAQFDAEKLDQAKVTLTPFAKGGDPEAMCYLGRIAIEQADGDAAVDWLEQAVKLNDRSSPYHQWLASAYGAKALPANPFVQMRLAPSVKHEMERAVELDSTNIEARVNLVGFYLQAPAMMGGGVAKAREQVAAIMKRDPYQGRLQEAAIAENQRDTVATERTLRDLVAAYPDSSAPVIRLALTDANLKRYDAAFALLEDRLRRFPDDGAALYQLGRVGAVSGARLDRAQWAIDRYLEMPHKRGNPSLAAAHWRRGMIFEAKGDKKTARTEYETALRLDPKLAGAKASLDKLK
ncbi:MAG TPA: DUF4386 family protein [Candidatus Dormibacteraeota bacterium]|nr:DUF4386 family protein [Candidatus Dormibacteraeota bacterium]